MEEYVDQHLSATQKERLRQVSNFIDGFESPYGLELLAFVDFAMNQTGSHKPEKVTNYIQQWSARKANIFSEAHIMLAVNHLLGAEMVNKTLLKVSTKKSDHR